jgi:carotenoid cleavage dioxygenase-like enzyme
MLLTHGDSTLALTSTVWLAGCRFEGDGMVHACRIKGGKVSYCNRFMQTHRLAKEKAAGRPVYAKVLSMLPRG